MLVLTKPLGTQVAVNLHQWIGNEEKWSPVMCVLTEEEAEKAYQRSMDSMARLNRAGKEKPHLLFTFISALKVCNII